ncbi:ABC transporter ATP-binding protein [Pseudorhizobium sp. NPDC055634]
MTIALETKALRCRFGAFVVTNDVSLQVEQGARHALIGPNGAGKTTLINLLTGVLKPSAGQVLLGGEDITDLAAHRRVKKGLTRTFQINQLFLDYTPLETVALAIGERDGVGGNLFRPLASYRRAVDEAAELLARFGLDGVMGNRTATLPYGKQRLLEIALALASRPKVLLLDEPAAGVPEDERHEVLAIVSDLPADVTVLLIEHDMDLVFSFASRITVLVAGAIFAEGSVAEVSRDPRVKAVYLGENA